MVMLTSLILDRKYPSSANLIQKVELSDQAEIWYLDELKYEGFNGDVHFLLFLTRRILFWSKFVPIIKIVCLKLNITIEFWIFELVEVPNFSLDKQF